MKNIILILSLLKDDYGMSYNEKIPWNVHKYVQMICNYKNKKNVVIYGRKTWENTTDKLQNTFNIIISSNYDITLNNTYVVNSIDYALKLANNLQCDNIIIYGGLSIFDYTLSKNIVNEIYMMIIDGQYECNLFFPTNNLSFIMENYYVFSNNKLKINNNKDIMQFIRLKKK